MKNLSEQPGKSKPGCFPFLRSQASLASAREVQAALKLQGIHSKIVQEREFVRLACRMPDGSPFNLRLAYVESPAELASFADHCEAEKRLPPSNHQK